MGRSPAEGPWENTDAFPRLGHHILRETPAVVGSPGHKASAPGPGRLSVTSTHWFDGHIPHQLVEFITKDDKSDCLFGCLYKSSSHASWTFRIELEED